MKLDIFRLQKYDKVLFWLKIQEKKTKKIDKEMPKFEAMKKLPSNNFKPQYGKNSKTSKVIIKIVITGHSFEEIKPIFDEN